MMNKSEQIHVLRVALEWALKHGVKAVDWCGTGYWQQAGYDGAEIAPPAEAHIELDRARKVVLSSAARTGESL